MAEPSNQILSVVDATTNQTSDVFVVPQHIDRIIVYVDVTAKGGALTNDAVLQVFLPDANDGAGLWVTISVPLPSADGIVTDTTYAFLLGLAATDTVNLVDQRVPLRGDLRVLVTVGDATTSTYKIFWQQA